MNIMSYYNAIEMVMAFFCYIRFYLTFYEGINGETVFPSSGIVIVNAQFIISV